MPAKEYYLEHIEQEFAVAREALNVGNDGKARVCARRAVGQAITWLLSKHPRDGWSADAMSQLKKLQDDVSFPKEVRDAAVRLTTKISERFTYPFSTDPLADAKIIIDHIEQIMHDAD
jgi:hypothetical protein